MADNTQLNIGTTGDTITTEDFPTTAPRQSSEVSTSAYKMPRSKIAVGVYGQDAGDAGPNAPLDVVSRQELRLAEEAQLRAMQASLYAEQRYSRERVPLLDRRGNFGRGNIR